MPARQTILIPGQHYHVFNRGHNKQQLFFHHQDYIRYINKIKEYLPKHEVTILAYSLMPNHVHFLFRQDSDREIQQFIHRLHTAYTMYFNIKYERIGSVFQGRFKAKMIESDEYLLHVSRYIHQNAIDILQLQGPALRVSKTVLKLIDYPWSTYKYYVDPTLPSPICDTSIINSYFSKTYKKLSYQNFVEDGLPKILGTPDEIEKMNNGDF